jgi:hypothetical protein
LGTVLLGTVPAEVVYVGLLEITKSGTRQAADRGGWSEEAAAGLADSCGGLVAGVATQGVTVPVEVVGYPFDYHLLRWLFAAALEVQLRAC